MSKENAERLREVWDRLMRRETAAALTLFDPDVVYEDDMLPDTAAETHRGVEGVVKAWARWAEPWADLETDLENVIDAGDYVVSIHNARGRAKLSGIEATLRYAYVWRFRENKVIHVKSFGDPEKALEAAGLSE